MRIRYIQIYTMLLSVLLFACKQNTQSTGEKTSTINREDDKKAIAAMLDSFNLAAARADHKGYFNYYADQSTFIGTDATENWSKDSFMVWSKPYFDRGKAWNFTSIQRNIYFDQWNDIAWFDELLNTQMKICRGSGVVVRQNGVWKVKQYVLSLTVPNSQVDNVVKEKTKIDDSLMQVISRK